MSEKEEDKVIDVGNEEIIDSEEWKDNFLKQGKWIRLFWMLAFSFAYYLSMTFLWLIVFIQFLFVLKTGLGSIRKAFPKQLGSFPERPEKREGARA